MSVTVNRTSLSERQLLSQLVFFQVSVMPFRMQDFSHADTHQVPGGSAVCFTISSAPTYLLVFLRLERMFFTVSRQGECY